MTTLAPPPLVLASASPRRRQLLAEHGYAARVVPTQVEESTDATLSVPELVLLNAQLKSAALWAQHPRAVVLGTDTLVCLDGRALGKPADLPPPPPCSGPSRAAGTRFIPACAWLARRRVG